MKQALLAIARDALLDHLERRDARHALRLLVAAMGRALGRACQLQALAPDGSTRWLEGQASDAPRSGLPLQRLGRVLGVLQVQGAHELRALESEFQELLPALIDLLHHAEQEQPDANPAAGADLIRAALAGADTFVWEWWIDNDWLSDIDQGFALLGYAPGQVGHTQEDWNGLIHPEDRAGNHEAYLRHECGQTPVYEHTYRIKASDGQWRWMVERGRIVERHADGRPRRMVGTQTDVTQRRAMQVAAQAAAQEAQSRLASIALSVPQVLFQSRNRPDGKRDFLYVSEHSRDVLGLEPEALLRDGDLFGQLIVPEDLAAAPASNFPGDGSDLVTEYRIRRADGQVRWLRLICAGQPQADGGTLWHGSMEDVTERRELMRSREDVAQAQAASRAKTQFLARMSHELRTPLNAVLGFAQLMELDVQEVPMAGQQRRLKLIREAGEHLLHMINDMLDLTRIEAGGMALQLEPVALRALVVQALALLGTQADKAQVKLVLLPGAEFSVQADRNRMRQVLLNLLSNAIKYNRPGGSVTVELAPQAAGDITVNIHDTGLGISEAGMARLFEPFQRGDQASSSVDGAGIGLAVTRALVQLMGGDIQVASSVGAGSSFSVCLPRAAHQSST